MEMHFTVEQVAERLQLHPETIRRQLNAGVLRGVRRGRQWRVPESALMEPTPIASSNRPQTVRAARGAMKSANHANVVQTFLEGKRADVARDAAKDLSDVSE